MFEINFNKIMDDLISEEYEKQCDALGSVLDLNQLIVEQAIKGFEGSEEPILIIEGLANIGSIVKQSLETFLDTCDNEEQKTLASIALIYLGSRKGLNNVVDEFRNQGKHENLAITKLVQSQIIETDKLIIERLRNFSLEDFKNQEQSHYINTLLIYLDKFSTHIPEDLRASFEKIKDSEVYKYYSLPEEP